MSVLSRIAACLRNLFRKRDVEQELSDELAYAFDALVEKKIGEGLSEVEARRQAAIELGGVEQLKEKVREAKAGYYIEGAVRDLRYAGRMLFKTPGFAVVAIATLALGIGLNTAIFSVINALLLQPLPFPEPLQLIALGMTDTRQKNSTDLNALSYPDFFDFRNRNHTLSSLAVIQDRSYAVADAGGATSIHGSKVSAEFFDVLEIRPVIGRAFSRPDEQPGGGPGGFKVIISDNFWRQHFGGDPNVLGRALEMDRRVYTVIGVMPSGFSDLIQSEPIDLWVTIAEDAATSDGTQPITQQRGNHVLEPIARLKPGVTVEQAQADLSAIAANLAQQYPNSTSFRGALLKPLREELIGDVRTTLYVLFGAVICVLLIANANVANLLLARGSVRGREIAIRAAVGASRGRIVRQLVTESVLVAGLGGLCGLILAQWATQVLVKLVPESIPRLSAIQLDGTVLSFTFLVSLGTGIFFGLVPALHASRVDLNSSLKSGIRASTGEHPVRWRNGLVMGEVVLALVLSVCAGLLIQTFVRLGRVQPGLQPDRLLTASVRVPAAGYPKNEDIIQFYDRLLERVRELPGIRSASVIDPLPLTDSDLTTDFDIDEHPQPEGHRPTAPTHIIGTDYFTTAGIPLRQGRGFDERDQLNSPPVVIVNERFAQKYFPGQNAIGKRIKPGFSADDSGEKMREITAVVGNVKHNSLRNEDSPEMYLPRTQIPSHMMSLVLRTKVSDPSTITAAMCKELAALDPSIPLRNVRVF